MGYQKDMLLKVPTIGWIMSDPPTLSLNGSKTSTVYDKNVTLRIDIKYVSDKGEKETEGSRVSLQITIQIPKSYEERKGRKRRKNSKRLTAVQF